MHASIEIIFGIVEKILIRIWEFIKLILMKSIDCEMMKILQEREINETLKKKIII